MKARVAHWLKLHLGEVDGLTRAYLFGSFYRGDANPKDVDLVVVFEHLSAVQNLTELRDAFRQEFGLPLHIQKFYEEQSGLIESFLERSNSWGKVYG